MREPVFAPLFRGRAARDPFADACAQARVGCDAGLVLYDLGADMLRAALVLAPDVPLSQAMAMLPLCGVGFQNALGALSPPEVAVHLEWDGGIRVNGGSCGRLRAAAATDVPADEPDWLVIGLQITLLPENDRPGDTPGRTALYSEGCADVSPVDLLEAWVRHTLVGINRWSDEGAGSLHREWTALAQDLGQTITCRGISGTFIGVDENLGLLIRAGDDTRLIPLTELLKEP